MEYHFKAAPYTADRIIDTLSITAAGRIGLPKYFLAKHGISRGVRASLFWDARHGTLAIEFTNATDAMAYPVVFTRLYGGFVNAARFFKREQINPREYVGRHPYFVCTGEDVGIATAATVFLLDPNGRQVPQQEQSAG
jgi:hypothetical protein